MLSCLVPCGVASAQSATLIQQVNPAPASPIVWQAPEAIPFGTPLSTLQLNAASATVGTFIYQPAIGSILPSGTTMLSVVLSPLDRNYAAESASVPITVVPPGSSGFTVTPLSASSPENPVTLQPGMAATVQLAVKPIGNFHQPVTLSCNAPFLSRKCVFSPAVIRPMTSPVQVALTLMPVKNAAADRSSLNRLRTNFFNSEALFPGIASSALLGMLFFPRRARGLTVWPAFASVLLVLPFLAALSGCGTGRSSPLRKIEILGKSLKETHIAQIYVLDEAHSPWVNRGTPHEGAER